MSSRKAGEGRLKLQAPAKPDRPHSREKTLFQISRAGAREGGPVTPDVPDSGRLARLLAAVEEGLRRRGFGEAAIKRHRKANRAVIEEQLLKRENRD